MTNCQEAASWEDTYINSDITVSWVLYEDPTGRATQVRLVFSSYFGNFLCDDRVTRQFYMDGGDTIDMGESRERPWRTFLPENWMFL